MKARYITSTLILGFVALAGCTDSSTNATGYRTECIDYSRYMHWTSRIEAEAAQDIAVQGQHAFVAFGYYEHPLISVYDLTANPPIPIASLAIPGPIRNVLVDKHYAYVSDVSEGLHVIDIENPASPHIVGSTPLSAKPTDMVLGHDHLYVAAVDGVHVVRISDPENPQVVKTVSTTDQVTSISVSGNYVYAVGAYAGFMVIDIHSPQDADIVWAETGGLPAAISASRTRAYVTDNQSGLTIYDITSPANPKYVINNPTIPNSDNILFVGPGMCLLPLSDSIRLINVSGDAVQPLADMNLRYATQLRNIDGRLYAVGPLGVDVIDPGSAEVFTPRNSFGLEEPVGQVLAYDQFLLAGGVERGGLRVVDLASTGTPTVVGSIESERILDMVVSGRTAYLATGTGGVQIIDLTDPALPKQLAVVDLADARAVAVQGHFLFASDRRYVHAVDISDPTTATILGTVELPSVPGGYSRISVFGEHAIVPGGPNGLFIIDVSQPQEPSLVATFPAQISVFDAIAEEGRAYVADFFGLLVLDLTDPTNPAQVGQVRTSGPVTALRMHGGFAYAINGVSESDLAIIDIRGSTPELIGSLSALDGIRDISPTTEAVFLSTFDDSVYVASAPCD